MFTLKRFTLSNFNDKNELFEDLYVIFCKSLNPTLTKREFKSYYFSHTPHFMDITFIYKGEEIVGFISASFYKHSLGNQLYTICRGAVGFIEGVRGGKLPSWRLCLKYITYKFKHPSEKVYLTGFMANPIMYSMICKYTRKVYPKTGIEIPEEIQRLKNDLITFYNLGKKVISPFVLRIHFQVHINAGDLQRIYSSTDRHVLFYLSLNQGFLQQAGLLTIVPVSWSNILASATTGLVVKPVTKFIRKNRAAKMLRAKLSGFLDVLKTKKALPNSGQLSN